MSDARKATGKHSQVFFKVKYVTASPRCFRVHRSRMINVRHQSRRIEKTRLRQHYHSDFGSLWQNVTRRREKTPRGHDLTPVAVSEE